MAIPTDIRLWLGFLRNHKVMALDRATGSNSLDSSVVCLLRLWLWAAESATDGDLSKLSPEDIEAVSGWTKSGDGQSWFDLLVELGFIEQVGDKQFLRNWPTRQPWVSRAGIRKRGGKARANTAARDTRTGQFLPVNNSNPSAASSSSEKSLDQLGRISGPAERPAVTKSLVEKGPEKSNDYPETSRDQPAGEKSLGPAATSSSSSSSSSKSKRPLPLGTLPVHNSTETSVNGDQNQDPRTPASGGSDQLTLTDEIQKPPEPDQEAVTEKTFLGEKPEAATNEQVMGYVKEILKGENRARPRRQT